MNYCLDKIITGFFVFIFGTMWVFSVKYYEKPKQYSLIVYDVFGNENKIYGIRTTFSTQAVAKNFIKEYQRSFPQYCFTIVSYIPEIKRRTIFNILLKKN